MAGACSHADAPATGPEEEPSANGPVKPGEPKVRLGKWRERVDKAGGDSFTKWFACVQFDRPPCWTLTFLFKELSVVPKFH